MLHPLQQLGFMVKVSWSWTDLPAVQNSYLLKASGNKMCGHKDPGLLNKFKLILEKNGTFPSKSFSNMFPQFLQVDFYRLLLKKTGCINLALFFFLLYWDVLRPSNSNLSFSFYWKWNRFLVWTSDVFYVSLWIKYAFVAFAFVLIWAFCPQNFGAIGLQTQDENNKIMTPVMCVYK